MALFKKVDCVECGKQTNPVFRTKLTDGQFICTDCVVKYIPSFMQNTFNESYSFQEFQTFKEYIRYSNEQLRPFFKETVNYRSIHLDEENYLFYLGSKITDETIFFELTNIDDFDLFFNPVELKEGLLSDKVKGDILLDLSMDVPRFSHEEKLVKNVKTAAKKKLFGTKLVYECPPDLEEFRERFKNAWIRRLEKNIEENQSSYVDESAPSDLSKAMALFMLDSMDGVTLDTLKAHRNRLMKTFHPDKGDDADTQFAQKINTAYEILKNYISSSH